MEQLKAELYVRLQRAAQTPAIPRGATPLTLVTSMLPLLPPLAMEAEGQAQEVLEAVVHWGPADLQPGQVLPPPPTAIDAATTRGTDPSLAPGTHKAGLTHSGVVADAAEQPRATKRRRTAAEGPPVHESSAEAGGVAVAAAGRVGYPKFDGLSGRPMSTADPLEFPHAAAAAAAVAARPAPSFSQDYSGLRALSARRITKRTMYTDPHCLVNSTVAAIYKRGKTITANGVEKKLTSAVNPVEGRHLCVFLSLPGAHSLCSATRFHPHSDIAFCASFAIAHCWGSRRGVRWRCAFTSCPTGTTAFDGHRHATRWRSGWPTACPPCSLHKL